MYTKLPWTVVASGKLLVEALTACVRYIEVVFGKAMEFVEDTELVDLDLDEIEVVFARFVDVEDPIKVGCVVADDLVGDGPALIVKNGVVTKAPSPSIRFTV